MKMHEIIRPDGLIIVSSDPPASRPEIEPVPHHACYVVGQFASVMEQSAFIKDEDYMIRGGEPDLTERAEVILQIRNETVASCGRVCTQSCRLSDMVKADESRLDVPLDIDQEDQEKLVALQAFIEYMLPDEDEEMSPGDKDIRAILDRQAEHILYGLYLDDTPGEVVEPQISDSYYQVLGRISEGNFHVMKMLLGRLYEIHMFEQKEGQEACEAKFGFSVEKFGQIGHEDLLNVLFHSERDFNYLLRLKSAPKGQVL